MTALVIAIGFTLTVSAFCSLLEAMVLSTTAADIEELKNRLPRRGKLLERFRRQIEETTSAILGLNTIANTLGATATGVLAAIHFGAESAIARYGFPIGMTVGILILSEVLPKNIGVLYRPALQPHLVYPLLGVRTVMRPVSYLCSCLVRWVAGNAPGAGESEREILLLAEKGAKEGSLTQEENTMIANALSLDDVRVGDVMTPRTVMTALDQSLTVNEVFNRYPNIPFARMPVYTEQIDEVIGLVRRRDLLKAKAEDQDDMTVEDLMHEITFIPENASGAAALEQFLKTHQQLAVVVDEYGSTAGVVTMEDIIEHILGQEIFEKDDIAIDMRELARKRRRPSTSQPGG